MIENGEKINVPDKFKHCRVIHPMSALVWREIKTNREQMKDCTKFMECLLLVIIEIRMDHNSELWG